MSPTYRILLLSTRNLAAVRPRVLLVAQFLLASMVFCGGVSRICLLKYQFSVVKVGLWRLAVHTEFDYNIQKN